MRYLAILSLITFCTLNAASQEKEYKYGRITFATGGTMEVTGKNMALSDSTFSYRRVNKNAGQHLDIVYELSKIQEIQVATSNHAFHGFILGTMVGASAMVIINKNVKEETGTVTGQPFIPSTLQ